MRSSLVRIVRLVVGLFYRRIEVAGLEHVPREGAVLFIANHNNGLVDPMVVLWALSRPVVFVAKSTFWKIPVLRSLLDLLGCVPVVRKGEGEPGISLKGEERNTAAFERLSSVLDAWGVRAGLPRGPLPFGSAPFGDPDWCGARSPPFEEIPGRRPHRSLVRIPRASRPRPRPPSQQNFSLFFFEYASWRERQARELLALLFASGAIARLKSERDALIAEIDELADTFRPLADNPRA